MKTIHKFPLAVADITILELPLGATVLHAGAQRGQPCVWVMLDTDEKAKEVRRVRVAGTGHPLGHQAAAENYVGTVMLHDGGLVFHVFDLDKAQP